MDQGSKMILDLILAKTPGQITEEDVNFLLARRSYVSSQDFERLGLSLPELLAKRDGGSPKVETGEQAEKKPLSKMNKEELIAEAASRGIAVPEGATNEAMRSLLK